MSCDCGAGQTLVDPCAECATLSAASEPLPSALDNFIEAFFGSLTKSMVNGKVVWTLPCQLNVGLPNNPRQNGEGLACYFLRLFEAGIIGLTGPRGLTGAAGKDGAKGYAVSIATVAQPTAECPNLAIPVDDGTPLAPDLYVFIPFSGYYIVQQVQDNVAYLTLVQASSNAGSAVAAGSLVIPAGPKGADGARGAAGATGPAGETGAQGPQGERGDAGYSAQAELLTSFTQPSGTGTVGWVTLSRELYAKIDQTLWIQGAGYYRVLAVAGTQVQLAVSPAAANVTAGTVISASSPGAERWVVVAGPEGIPDNNLLSWKDPVRLVSTVEIPVPGPGVPALNGMKTIDGVLTQAGDRVLVTKQDTDPTTNGIYIVQTGDWTRALDADVNAELPAGSTVVVQAGDTHAASIWTLLTADLDVGIDDQYWGQTSAGPIAYGELYVKDASISISFSAPSTWTQVTGLPEGLVSNFTSAASRLTCYQAGVYKVSWTLSFQTASATDILIEGGVAVNATMAVRGRNARTVRAADGSYELSGSLLVELEFGDIIDIRCQNGTDTSAITVGFAELNAVKIS